MSTIIFDFDDTLFDTQATKEARCAALGDLGLPPELFWNTYVQTRSEYSHEHHAMALAAHGFDAFRVKNTLDNAVPPERMSEFVFPGTVEILQELRAARHELMLLSLTIGTIEVQRRRIAHSGLTKFFTDVHVVKKSKQAVVENVAASASPVWFINDKITETIAIQAALPRVRVLLRRPPKAPLEPYAASTLPFVNNLSEIKKYVI